MRDPGEQAMNPKREHILECALRCFAAKGYHATSIQEIAEAAGIAKGLVYFYFKSKEDLLLSGLRHYYAQFEEKLLRFQSDSRMSAHERLHVIVRYLLEHSREGRDFFVMMLAEQTGQVNEQLSSLLVEVRVSSLERMTACVMDIYGEAMEPYALDAASIIHAILNDFVFFFAFTPQPMSGDILASFIMERLDEMVEGMLSKGRPPLLDANMFNDSLAYFQERVGGRTADWKRAVLQVRRAVERAELAEERRDEALACLNALESEQLKQDRNMVVVRGMLSYLRTLGQQELQQPLDALERVLTIQPLNENKR
jgi:AcrR family transcriptional regulator